LPTQHPLILGDDPLASLFGILATEAGAENGVSKRFAFSGRGHCGALRSLPALQLSRNSRRTAICWASALAVKPCGWAMYFGVAYHPTIGSAPSVAARGWPPYLDVDQSYVCAMAHMRKSRI